MLPYVGPGWCPTLAAMGISARSHVDAATLRRALERMDAAWSEGEAHGQVQRERDDRPVGAQHGGGLLRQQAAEQRHRPIHNAALGFKHCMVAKVKTDCLLTQRLPKRFAERLWALEALRHPDGTPVYRVLLTGCRAPERRTWPGPLWQGCESRARRCAWCPRRTAPRRTWAWGRRRPTTECAGTRGQRAKAGLAGGGGDHAAGHGALGGPGLRGADADVKFLLLGDFWQSPAVLDSSARRWSTASSSATWPAGTGTSSSEKWLRVAEEACAGEAEGALPLQARVATQRRTGPWRRRPPIGDTSHPHRFGLPNNQWVYCAPKQPAEHVGVAGAAPHWGRRKDTQGRLCGRGGSGAGRSEAGQRHAAEEPGAAVATRPSHAVTCASCQTLTLHNRVRLDLESCHLTLRHLYVGASRATSSELLEAARRGPRRGSAPSPSCTSRACLWRSP